MLDIHTHILPEIDDGSKSVGQSIEMLTAEFEQGIDRVALTPHFYPGSNTPERFLKNRDDAVRKLKAGIRAPQRTPKMHLGAEVEYFDGMGRVEIIEEFCIGGTQAMLIEMPFARWNANTVSEIDYLMQCRGIQPVIAHIERYIGYQPPGTLDILCEKGFWIQSNASFFTNWRTKRTALSMLKRQQIHFVGSDCHDTVRRPPMLGEALSVIDSRLGRPAFEYLDWMQRRLLEG